MSSAGRRPRIDFQAKATAKEPFPKDAMDFSFDLKVKNYNDLRADTIVPRLLIVVIVPKEDSDWASYNESKLVLRRCGYWKSLSGRTDTNNDTKVRIHIPRANRLTPRALKSLMDKVNRKEPL